MSSLSLALRACCAAPVLLAFLVQTMAIDEEQNQIREYLDSLLYTQQEVDDWLAGKAFTFAKYDSGLGYLYSDYKRHDALDGSYSNYDYVEDKHDVRRMFNYADQPCRINTYGNSFTNCAQVNDGETWQEYLAAHLCEPVRNYGIGGYSVYLAYLRMLREEEYSPADVIVFNIFESDHQRNLYSWQSIPFGQQSISIHPPVPYVEANPATGSFVEYPNPCPTEDSIYNLCDPDWVYERFKDDFNLKIVLAKRNQSAGTPEKSYRVIEELARENGLDVQVDSPQKLAEVTEKVFDRAAFYASKRIVEKVDEFAAANGKKVVYVLSYGSGAMAAGIREGKRFDQEFVDWLKGREVPVVDLMEEHRADYKKYKVNVDDYLSPFYVGHYGPLGNLFTAFAIKDEVLKMLDPKPVPYREEEQPALTLRGWNEDLWGRFNINILEVAPRGEEGRSFYLWFYEHSLFDALEKGHSTFHGPLPSSLEVTADGSSAMISALGDRKVQLQCQVVEDGVDLELEVTNHTDYTWPGESGLIPCFFPGSPDPNNPNPPITDSFRDEEHTRTYFLGADGIEVLENRDIHFNHLLKNPIERIYQKGPVDFTVKWPRSKRDAHAGLMTRESSSGGWVASIAWEDFVSVQGHNPLRCMHLGVRLGPLEPGQKKKVHGKIYLFQGSKENGLKRFEKDFHLAD